MVLLFHLVAFFPFLMFCFEFCLLFFSFLSKNATKKPDTAKTHKSKNAEKTDRNISVSAVVFTNSVPSFLGVGFKNADFAENIIKIVVSTYFEGKGQRPPKYQKG